MKEHQYLDENNPKWIKILFKKLENKYKEDKSKTILKDIYYVNHRGWHLRYTDDYINNGILFLGYTKKEIFGDWEK